MDWRSYWEIVRRRWPLVAIILLLDLLGSGYLFAKSYRSVGYQGCITLYVADVSSPGVTLETTDQLLAGETAANFFADDILDVAQSADVATAIGRALNGAGHGGGNTSFSVTGARKDRTVNLCVTDPSAAVAGRAATELGTLMSSSRARFIGRKMADRTYVRVISPASVSRAPAGHALVNLLLRLVLGLLVGIGLALLWDAMDPTVRNRADVEGALGAPVLAGVGRPE